MRAPRVGQRKGRSLGQALVETALVLPIFLAVIFGTIVFGFWLFYQQEITNAAREGARYAAVHSASSDCPVNGWLAPAPGAVPEQATLNQCASPDTPAGGWPAMTSEARTLLFGMNPSDLHIAACWSGYQDGSTMQIDAGPYNASTGANNVFLDCTMNGGTNPLTDGASLPCPATTSPTAPSRQGSGESGIDGDDQASNLAVSDRELAVAANRVVVYACYNWNPPLAGFLVIPSTVVIRAVYSEALQHQR